MKKELSNKELLLKYGQLDFDNEIIEMACPKCEKLLVVSVFHLRTALELSCKFCSFCTAVPQTVVSELINGLESENIVSFPYQEKQGRKPTRKEEERFIKDMYEGVDFTEMAMSRAIREHRVLIDAYFALGCDDD